MKQPVAPIARIPARRMPEHLPALVFQTAEQLLDAQVQVQVFRHRSTPRTLTIPAVAEPLLVLVVAGAAIVEERVADQAWTRHPVRTGDFFLTTSPVPYEMRWQTQGDGDFEVVHVYLGEGLLDLAAREQVAGRRNAVRLREVSGERDGDIADLMGALYREATTHVPVSTLYLHSLGQALAVHLLRHYREVDDGLAQANALPSGKLHRALAQMRASLDSDFSLSVLAASAGMSVSHFSRLFKKATGVNPSRYFINLRMDSACRLLLESQLSIIEIALEVGYNSPSHFAQVFKRHCGTTPREYRRG